MPQEGILCQLREHTLRLTKALYRVSERFPEHEPLRGHCREYADEILARITVGDPEKKADKIIDRIDALCSFLLVAAETGWAHSINIEVLIREYSMLRDTVEQALLWVPEEEDSRRNGETLEVFDVPARSAPMPISARAEQEAEQEKDMDSIKPAPDLYHESTSRQRKILQHIAEVKQAKISDLFPVLSGVSSKTIQRDLSELVSKNVLKREGEKRWTTYMLA